MAKKVVAHIIQSLNTGGCETKLLRTLPLLSDQYQSVIFTLKERGVLADKFEEQGIRVVPIGLKGFFDRDGIKKLITAVRREKPSLVITYLFHADLIGRLFVQRAITAPLIPSLVTTYNFIRYLPARLFEYFSKGMVRHYLANSPAVKSYYVQKLGVPEEKITVLPNGMDLAIFDQLNPGAFRRELKLNSKTFVITCVANLAANKGHRFLLSAFEDFFASYPNSALVLAGTGVERENLQAQVKDYRSQQRIFFLGSRSDVPQILVDTNAFVLPTLFEGMSIAIMEAMAARVPVITTDIPENRALITGEKTGLLVPVKTVEPITAALKRLASEPQLSRQLASAARQSIERHYEIGAVARQWKSVIRRLGQ